MINRMFRVLATAAVAAVLCAPLAHAQTTVGGAPMLPNRTIPENASQAPNLSTLVTAVTAAGLVDTLAGPGPFTVFAPTNSAFARLPAGTVETLLQPANRDKLRSILTYHVVAGTLTAEALARQQRHSPDNLANLRTVEGSPISVRGAHIYDESGNIYRITQTNLIQANGVVHIIDGVLLPQ